MAAANFAQALALVLVHEGGKSDDPHDPGGRTNWGITHIDYDAYRKSKGLPLQDVYLMTETERDEIYRTQYWDPIRGDDLPAGLDYVVFDGGVNSGIGQSVKWLQRSIPALPANGRVAQALVTAASQVTDLTTLIETCCEARREFLQSLSTFQYFGNGWMTRVNDVQATALAWATGAAPAPAASPSSTSQPKALRESAAPLPSTAPGDVTAAASAVGIAATVIAHSTAAPATPASPSVAGTSPALPSSGTAPSTTSAPSQPPAPSGPVASTAPTGPAVPAPSAPAGPAPTTPSASSPSLPAATAPAASAPTALPGQTPAPGSPAAQPPPITTAQANVPAKPTPAPIAKPLPAAPAPTPSAPPQTPVVATLPPTAPKPAPAPHQNLGPSLLSPPSKTAGPESHAAVPSGAQQPAIEAKPGIVTAPHAPTLFFGIPDSLFPEVLGVLVMTFLFGLYKTFSSRSARARISDALGDNPIPKTALKIGKIALPIPVARAASSAAKAPPPPAASETGIPLVHSLYARALSVLWIAATIVVNVIALAELLQGFGFAHENWHQPLVWLSNVYNSYAGQAFNLTSASVSQQFGVKLPPWLLPVFVLYVSSASAFVVASTGLMKRNTSGEALFAAVVHAGWIFAVPAFVMDAVRYHVVTRFARQNTVLFFGYLASFLVVYMAARFINDDILPGFMQQYGATAGSMITNGAAAASAISKTIGGQ